MSAPAEELVCGRRAVLEALRAGRPCQRLLIARGGRGAALDEIFQLVRAQRVPYDVVDRQQLDRLATVPHQGVIARLAARPYADYEELLDGLPADSAFVVYLDSIQDPHNLGAVLRSAHASGAHGVVVQERGAAGLTAAAVRAAAGAAEHIPIARVPNLTRALQQARDRGLWLLGLAAEGSVPFTQADYRISVGLVVGSEGSGLRRLVRATCDALISIPMARSEVGSLNASVAAGLVLYEVYRQRLQG